ncbi:MAG: hypothetical protein IJQ60_12760 [Prevotella sp.]|nr:hypothetical protein [Prevotella sp.]MBR0264739.1 hypothetical protein [Prevotella sp.]
MELSKLVCIFALKIKTIMKESKPYPHIEEENGSTLTANESVGALSYTEECIDVEPEMIPGLPQSWNELQECLKEGEEEYERGEYIPWEVATQRLKTRIREYGS